MDIVWKFMFITNLYNLKTTQSHIIYNSYYLDIVNMHIVNIYVYCKHIFQYTIYRVQYAIQIDLLYHS